MASQNVKRLSVVVGMGASWLPIIERLLYPVSFTFANTGDVTVYLYNIIYSILVIFLTLGIGITSRRTKGPAFVNKYLILLTGIGGALGVILVGFLDLSNPFNGFLIGIGVMLVAAYVPIHFTFWSICFAGMTGKSVLSDAAFSFVLVSFVYALLATFGISTLAISIVSPLISALLGFAILRTDSTGIAIKRETLAFNKINKISVYVVILILFCNIAIAYFNNSAKLQAVIPYRALIFWGQTFIFALIAYLYYPSKKRKPATMGAFTVVSLSFVGMLFVAIFVSGSLLNVGTVPLNCANSIMIAFVWLLIVRAANKRQESLVFVTSVYLALVVLLPRFLQACIMYGSNYITLFAQSINYLYLVVAIVFLAICFIVVALLKAFLGPSESKPDGYEGKGELDTGLKSDAVKDEPDTSAELPSTLSAEFIERARHDAQYEAVLQSLMEDEIKLSGREVEVAQLALKNYSAKKIAEMLYVSVNTVNSHLKSIYQKTGVHSKQEFIDFVESQIADSHSSSTRG